MFYAAAFAYELKVRKSDPRKTSYSGASLRQWVTRSFETGNLEAPAKRPGRAAERVTINNTFHHGSISAADAEVYLAQRESLLCRF